MLRICVGVAVLMVAAGCVSEGGPAGPIEHEHQVVERDTSSLTRVRLTMGAGTLEVRGGAAKLVEADFDYNVPAWKPLVTHHATGTERDVEISQGSVSSVFGKTENQWRLVLNDATPIDLVARLAAGQARLTLGSLNLRHVELHMGAGEADVDLRGSPEKSYRAEIQGGVGSATVHVPTSVAIAATASGGIGDIKVSGLEKRGDRWINPRAESAPVTIELDVHGGVGEIRIIAE